MTPFTVLDAPQRSPVWRQARCGLLTGSRAEDMLATIKSGEAAKRRDLRVQLVTERLTGQPQDDDYVNAAMQWGTDHEAEARAAYEAVTGRFVLESGFLTSTSARAGCSLDGHVGDFEGIVELKCPKSATHLAYLRAGVVPSDHLAQITHNLWISGAAWCDFASFDPRFPENLRLFLARVTRTDDMIVRYATKALVFLDEVAREETAIRGLRPDEDVLP